ncbi:MAG: hypothetical protein L0H41_00805 [Microlunatus sp.]|nr:hypothetical protein [Microlunatus sp.]MDN5770094.1 hypothetical protein [Microlunatus sp.]
MTVSTKVISTLYPVVGGAVTALVTRGVLVAARRFVVGTVTPPPDQDGGTAGGWKLLSWAVSGGVGFLVGRQLIRP